MAKNCHLRFTNLPLRATSSWKETSLICQLTLYTEWLARLNAKIQARGFILIYTKDLAGSDGKEHIDSRQYYAWHWVIAESASVFEWTAMQSNNHFISGGGSWRGVMVRTMMPARRRFLAIIQQETLVEITFLTCGVRHAFFCLPSTLPIVDVKHKYWKRQACRSSLSANRLIFYREDYICKVLIPKAWSERGCKQL